MANEFIQECMDSLRRMEYRMGQIENDRIAATATRAISSLISQYHREMANSWGLDLKLIPDSVLKEEFDAQFPVEVAEPEPAEVEAPPVVEPEKKGKK